MKADRVIVIGGGFAGLAAAHALTRWGVRVTLLERKPHLGGRAYSFVDDRTGDEVDNGQHLLMGCYTETIDFLREIGSAHKLRFQEDLRVDFLEAGGRVSSLACAPLPAPFHVLLGILRMRGLSLTDRWSSLLLGWGMARAALGRRIERETAEEWLRAAGQSEEARSRLWDIVTLATLNERPERASAKMLATVIREALLTSRSKSRIVISKVGLSSLYTEDARRAIESGGGEVRPGATVRRIRIEGGRATGVLLAGGERIPARVVISAVPAPSLAKMLGREALALVPGAERCRDLPTSPILSVNIWFDRPFVPGVFMALHGTEIQWLFNRDRIHARDGREGHYLSFVVSNATGLVELPKREIIERVLADLRRLLPQSSEARVLRWVIVKEREATVSLTPETDRLRPEAETACHNLLLAGDWTDTGLPATIEGAVRSGRRAASLALGRA